MIAYAFRPRFRLLAALLLAGCTSTVEPTVEREYLGRWYFVVPDTDCWPGGFAIEMDIQQYSSGGPHPDLTRISSWWRFATESRFSRPLAGSIDLQRDTFSLTFWNGIERAVFAGSSPSPERLEGVFTDVDDAFRTTGRRTHCSAPVFATKTGDRLLPGDERP